MFLHPSSEAAICPIIAVVIAPPDPGITPAAGTHLSARLCGGLGENAGIEATFALNVLHAAMAALKTLLVRVCQTSGASG